MKLSNPLFALPFLTLLSVFVLSGCTTIPTSVGFNDDDDEYFSSTVVKMAAFGPKRVKKSDIKELKATPKEMGGEDIEAEIESEEDKPVVFRDTFSSTKGYWQAALTYLQTGDVEGARWALEKALMLNSRSRVANKLMHQLDVDASVELGSAYFEYKVQYGDTLSKLSNVYLNDPFKFYLLAKYNGIENPGRLDVGQIIRIPGNKNPFQIAPVADIKVAKKRLKKKVAKPVAVIEINPSVQLLDDARDMLAAGEHTATIELLESNAADANAKTNAVLVKAYYLEAKTLLKEKEFVASTDLLNRAIALDPENAEVNMMLIDMSETGHADDIYQQSIEALAQNNFIIAYDLIKKALQVQPANPQFIDKKNKIAKQLSSYYYKQALMAQRKHELDTAIEYWDEVLALDEYNDNAKLYRVKAISLKIRLEKFVSSK